MPPSSGKREESSLMTNAPGTKKKIAASTQRLMEEGPLWPAAAIQRGPRTVAVLNSSTSQKPMLLRSCDLGSRGGGAGMVMRAPEAGSWILYGFAQGLKPALLFLASSARL